MQLNKKQITVGFTLALTFLSTPSFAQQNDKTLLAECLTAHAKEFQPLSVERKAVYQSYSNRILSIRSILRWLEQDPTTADAKRRKEIAALEARLQALRTNANRTDTEAIKDVAGTIEAVNVMLEDINDERDATTKPFARRLTVLQRKYNAAETKLKPAILGLFREQGDSESIADISRSYGSFSYSAGTASATYKRRGQNQSAAICYIYLVNEKNSNKKYGLFNEKYPIVYRSKHQLEIIVGRSRVTIYSSDPKIADQQLDASLASLVDIKALETMLTP